MRGVYHRDKDVPVGVEGTMDSIRKAWKHLSQDEIECWAKMYEKALGVSSKVMVFSQLRVRTVRVFNFHPQYFTSSIDGDLFCELWFMPVENLVTLLGHHDLLVQSIVTIRLRDNL